MTVPVQGRRERRPWRTRRSRRQRWRRGGDAAVPRSRAQRRRRRRDAEFPAGSYIIRMDQPYSRIADALLDYQFWSPNDPQKTPYDDTGWTFPEGFAVQAVRVTDPKVLDAPMEPVTGEIKAPGGVTGSGSTFPHQRQRRQRARHAALQAQERRHPGGRGAVRRGRHAVRRAGRSSSRACRSRDLDAAAKDARPQGRRPSRARRA